MSPKNSQLTVGLFTFAKRHHRSIEKCGSSMWRGEWYWRNWPEAENYIEGKHYDVVIFQKVWHPELYERVTDSIKILDICDPEWLQSDWPIFEIASKVDAIVTSSEGLYTALKTLGIEKYCPVMWIDDRVDLSYFQVAHRKAHTGTAKTIGWFGYAGNGEKALPIIVQHAMMHNLKLHIIAERSITFANYEHMISHAEFNWATLPFEMYQCDFLVNPPIISPYAQYKSKNKTYLAWTFGLPVAHNSDEFIKFIDGTAREEESKRVYDLVRADYTVQTSINQYKSLIESIWTKKNSSK